ncbi:hypothetical protein JB92DRAFT_2838508 [Gautieria morchelliformis]|nr:hypothetical protein JB92DRAFT_2838508 [Gautieria morchelliformis]
MSDKYIEVVFEVVPPHVVWEPSFSIRSRGSCVSSSLRASGTSYPLRIPPPHKQTQFSSPAFPPSIVLPMPSLVSSPMCLAATATKIHKQRGEKAPDTPDVELSPGEAEDLVPSDKRPTHRLPVSFLPFSLPLIGKKVDSISWARAEIVRTNALLEQARAVVESEGELPGGAHEESNGEEKKKLAKASYPPLSSTFILFHQQIGAHMAAQMLVDGRPLRMADKYIEVAPPDVVRVCVAAAAIRSPTVFRYYSVTFMGTVSNIASLCTSYKWLAWLSTIPPEITGIIQDILPPVLFALLFSSLPSFEGIPTGVGIELSLMDRFFLFQVIHGFLSVTLSSGIIAALPVHQALIHLVSSPHPSPRYVHSPPRPLWHRGRLLNIVSLIIYYVKLTLLGSTPRSIYSIRYTMRDVAWGTLLLDVTFESSASFFCCSVARAYVSCSSLTLPLPIASPGSLCRFPLPRPAPPGLGYSIISPIINGLAVDTFSLFYMLYKYLFTWQPQMDPAGDSGVCLCALFFLAQNDRGKQAAVPEGELMVVLIVATAFFLNILNTFYTLLLKALPLTFADCSRVMPDAPRADGAKGGKVAEAVGKEKVSKEDTDENGYEGDEGDQKHPGATPAFPEHLYAPPLPTPLPTHTLSQATLGRPQRPIWIAADSLGIGLSEVKEMCADGIRPSVGGARMDAKGNVEVWSVGEGEMLSSDGE